MAFEVIVAPQAARDLRRLNARSRSAIRDAIEAHLRHEPMKLSRSRIKRLQGLSHPQYRLRVGDTRVFYDVVDAEVHVPAILAKADADAWLVEEGQADEEDPSLGSEG